MAQSDLEQFIIERLRALDVVQDLSSGSPADVKVVQPILRRLGSDPFTVDIALFLQKRINQLFPDLAIRDGDALTDLLVKMNTVLWEPITREITRVKRNLSFKDPTTLTADEAEALGANLFSSRNPGAYARGVGRVYFAAPQGLTANPENYATSRSGLHYTPTEPQSIRAEEMILNLEGNLYYFDVDFVAENPGDAYNLDVDQLASITGIGSAVRITNKTRFRDGLASEDTVTYIGRTEQELTERSLVTTRGILSRLSKEFSEVTQIGVVGFNDPEMHRDVLRGGGLGSIFAAGVKMRALPDGEAGTRTRRVQVDLAEPVDFHALIAATGPAPRGYTLTLHGGFPVGSLPLVRDLHVRAVLDPTTLDLEEQALDYAALNLPWTLRRNELTLSGIPGGIVFPNVVGGTVVPDDMVHIGGMTDVYVRGASFDAATLLLTDLVDDDPLLRGVALETASVNTLSLTDFVLAPGAGANYSVGDATYAALLSAKTRGLSLQILDPPNAATYRILDVVQVAGAAPLLTVTPAVTVVVGDFRWRLTDTLDIDLVEPKETKIAGADLRTVQGTNVVDTVGGVDFDAQGVGPGDTLRIFSGGLIESDYTVVSVGGGFFTQIQVDKLLPATVNGARYAVFRKNASGGVVLPFIRVVSIDLLDTSNQPVGATVPYARPVDLQSRGFANVARGVKADVADASLGLVSKVFPLGVLNLDTLTILVGWASPLTIITVTFAGVALTPQNVVDQINGQVSAATGGAVPRIALVIDDGLRVGLLPVFPNVTVAAGTGVVTLFGVADTYTTRDIHSAEVFGTGGWAQFRPALDLNFDVAQVLDGNQVGFYDGLVDTNPFNGATSDALRTSHDFNPEARRHLQVGARSLGTVRAYFLEPTSFEVDGESAFTYVDPTGAEFSFLPDPTNNYQRIPSLPSGVKPKDGGTGGPLPVNTLQSSSTDFIAKGIQPGDLLVLDYVPLTGSVVLTDPVDALNARSLSLSISGGNNKSILFIRDSSAILPTQVTRQGVIDQINKAAGQVICGLNVLNRLEFNPDLSIIVRGAPTLSPTSANVALGFSTVDLNNDGPNKGSYVVTAVAPGGDPTELVVATPFPSGVTGVPRQQFKVFRQGVQRISSTDMAKNIAAAGLYYFDVQLISEGTGDQYNLEASLPFTAQGYRADGYYLTTRDPNLSFSPAGDTTLHLSTSLLQVGTSDDPANATLLAGQNLLVNYERSSLTDNVNGFINAETERVINENPLGRHLIPHFVRFDLFYVGGSKENEVLPDIETYVNALTPDAFLEVSALERIVQNRGATSIQNPIDLIAVVHNPDRTITVQRSQDRLNTGRLAAFLSDRIVVTRQIG